MTEMQDNLKMNLANQIAGSSFGESYNLQAEGIMRVASMK